MSEPGHEQLARRIQAVLASPSDRLDRLVAASGIDPATDLRFGDWRGFDLTEADLRGFDFMGADLTGARFRNARIAGANFDRAAYDLAALREAEDFAEFLRQEMRRPPESRRRPPDWRLKDFERFRDAPVCPELVVIPAGEFMMGSALSERKLKEDDRAWEDEIVKGQGKRRMRIAQRFALGRYPVTFEEYDAFLAALRDKRKRPRKKPSDQGWGRDRRPAINISWNDAQAFCKWLNERVGLRGERGYRLPSEAEWEYACRAGTQTRRWWGDAWDSAKANGRRSYEGGKTSSVGDYAPNPWGLHDMIGNVWEWCADCWADNIAELPADATPYPGTKDSLRVLRGGSWFDSPHNLRSAVRVGYLPDDRSDDVGFRVARTL